MLQWPDLFWLLEVDSMKVFLSSLWNFERLTVDCISPSLESEFPLHCLVWDWFLSFCFCFQKLKAQSDHVLEIRSKLLWGYFEWYLGALRRHRGEQILYYADNAKIKDWSERKWAWVHSIPKAYMLWIAAQPYKRQKYFSLWSTRNRIRPILILVSCFLIS